MPFLFAGAVCVYLGPQCLMSRKWSAKMIATIARRWRQQGGGISSRSCCCVSGKKGRKKSGIVRDPSHNGRVRGPSRIQGARGGHLQDRERGHRALCRQTSSRRAHTRNVLALSAAPCARAQRSARWGLCLRRCLPPPSPFFPRAVPKLSQKGQKKVVGKNPNSSTRLYSFLFTFSFFPT